MVITCWPSTIQESIKGGHGIEGKNGVVVGERRQNVRGAVQSKAVSLNSNLGLCLSTHSNVPSLSFGRLR